MPNQYTPAHKSPKGPGDARPTALQIVEDNGLKDALKDKVILLTGSSSGIGTATARALAATGARCFLGTRSLEKGLSACSSILVPGRVELLQIDTSSLSSVRAAAATFLSKSSTLNILVNNAGIMACPEARTEDGFESQFATNFLGHFALFRELEGALVRGAEEGGGRGSRVVNVASSGHHASGVVFDNIGLEGAYDPWVAYGQSKTAMIYMANEIERRYGGRGIHGLSLMPGGIATALQVHMSEETKARFAADEKVRSFMKSPEQGAATTVFAALSAEWEGRGGVYLEDCDVAGEVPPGQKGAVGVMPYAFDQEKEGRLWEMALKMVEMKE